MSDDTHDRDTQLLDYLDSLPAPTGMGWKLRASTTGRGWRLQTTTRTPNYKTAREAIQAFSVERAKEIDAKEIEEYVKGLLFY